MIRRTRFSGVCGRFLSTAVTVAASALFLSLSATAFASNIVADSGFESATGTTPGSTTFYTVGNSLDGGSWLVSQGTVGVDTQDNYVFNGNNSVWLNADITGPDSITQTLATAIGQKYAVEFWANSEVPNTFSVTFGGTALTGGPTTIVQNGFPSTVTGGNASQFKFYYGFGVATSTSTDLVLTGSGFPGPGTGVAVELDDVTVAATPEPGTVVLMLSGLAGLVLLVARKRVAQGILALLAVAALASGTSAFASAPGCSGTFTPGNLVVSRSVYQGTSSTVTVGQALPGGGTAVANGTYPQVFNNATPDSSFGISSPIYLDQMAPWGNTAINCIAVPINGGADHLVTSFPSKSELGLHLSTDGKYLTFMGYVAATNQLDASNANTPGVVDATNTDTASPVYRAVATVNAAGQFTFTETNAYSGNNGRAAILYNTGGNNVFYTAGNAGNGANPQPAGVLLGAGAQIITPSVLAESSQAPGSPTPVASFNINQLTNPGTGLPYAADKAGKDDNFRGMTIYNNVLYFTKGSGSNGANTVYFVDTTGTACPNGIGLPKPGAILPTSPLSYNPANLTGANPIGLPSNMCILKGFPITSNKVVNPTAFPFGIWFASPTVLYVADEGNGTATYTAASGQYTAAAAQTTAGLQKWIFNSATQQWELKYTLKQGLNLGIPYVVAGYPTGNNGSATKPWAPATDGLRHIIGTVANGGAHGTYATIWATSSTVSGSGDQGADPNKLFVIVDNVNATTLPAGESFTTLRTAANQEVLRGVSFTPGTAVTSY